MNVDSTAEIKSLSKESLVEKRSSERLEDDRKLRVHEAWLSSLDERVENGILTPKEKNRRISLADLRKEKKYLREKRKNYIDPMTGLGRQEHLRPKLDEIIARGKPFAILFTDLDKFSEINEEYGHPAGDEIIAQTGLRIHEGLRDETSGRKGDEAFVGDPYRNGGDESAIILPGIDDRDKLAIVGNRIRTLINSAPFTVPHTNQKIDITVSIGGMVWDGKSNRDDFLKAVDDYLFKAKETRGSLAI